MNLLTQNSKLKKDNIFSFGIPAKDTCLAATTCKKFCYAAKGFYLMPTVKQGKKARLKASKLKSFPTKMIEEITKRKAKIIRIHDSGDFYSREYLHKWFKVMESLPQVKFYAYTKMIPLMESEKLPKNFTVIYSIGGKYDHLIDPKKHRHSAVFKDKIPRNYINASDSDLEAIEITDSIFLVT